jgi:hypothetical protein
MVRLFNFGDCEFHSFSISLVTLTYLEKPLSRLKIFQPIKSSLHQINPLSLKPWA